MERLSDKDLHWLYWGSEEEEIISKLINEENKFKDFISNLKFIKPDLKEKDIFINILLSLKDEKSDLRNTINATMTDDQLKRLHILDKKYGLLYDLIMEQNKTETLNMNKTNIIKAILQEYNENYEKLIKELMLDDKNNSEEKYKFIYRCKAKIQEKGYETNNDEIKELTKKCIIKCV
jgi:hypothetical protein